MIFHQPHKRRGLKW